MVFLSLLTIISAGSAESDANPAFSSSGWINKYYPLPYVQYLYTVVNVIFSLHHLDNYALSSINYQNSVFPKLI